MLNLAHIMFSDSLPQKIFLYKAKIIREKYCFVSENFVPLHYQIETAARRTLGIGIAKIKSRNCAH